MAAPEPRSEREAGRPVPPGAAMVIVVWASTPGAEAAQRDSLAAAGRHVPAGAAVVACAGEQAVEQVSRALAEHPDRDLVLLQAGAIVAPNWIEGLRAAAYSDSALASATPLSLGEGGVDAELGEDHGTLARVAQRLYARAPRLRPRLARIGPACAYLRRSALELVGGLPAGMPIPAALALLEQRMSACGLLHVAADEVLVDCRTLARPAPPVQSRDAVRETVEGDDRSPLHRARAAARWSVQPTVTIDGRSLVAAYGGTQTYLLGLIRALGEAAATTRVLVPPDLSPLAHSTLAELDVEAVSYEQVVEGGLRSQIVHRPQQVFSVDDLNLLRLAGERVVVGQQDLIAYHNRSYHADADRWRAYRRVTRLALAVADQVVLFSEHTRADLLTEELLEPARASVIGIGPEDRPLGDQARPRALQEGEPFLLCLGADYAHKNRPFALGLQQELMRLGWEGRLLLAGAHVEHGSSREREGALLEADTALRGSVLELGPVSEAERRWLMAHARALVNPSIYEGFGLVPAEAAAWGVPCLFAAVTSLAELAGAAATLIPWDPAASAAAVREILEPGPAREEHLRRLRSLELPSWQDVAAELLEVYARAAAAPPPPGAHSGWQELVREREVDHHRRVAHEYQDAYHRFEQRVGAGLPLVEEGGLLTHQQQRGLMRVASRGTIGRLAMWPFELLGRGSAAPDSED